MNRRKFDEGETDIMVSTDAIAMGMNLPVKRIVFSALSKFIDNKENPLTFSEIKQISGRAGRFKRFPVGEVTTLNKVEDGTRILKNALAHTLSQNDKAMVGPDLDIFSSVNNALDANSLPSLSLSEFLRLFNTMTFRKPFYCVDMKEMIELAKWLRQLMRTVLYQTQRSLASHVLLLTWVYLNMFSIIFGFSSTTLATIPL